MSGPGYAPLVVEHFERPRNAGRFRAAADVIVGSAGDSSQGTRFVLSARLADGRIADVRFEAYGCPHCIAAGSWVSERLIGSSREDLRHWSWREASMALRIPVQKHSRLLLLEDAVQALAAAWDRSMPSAGHGRGVCG